ncbi:MAG: type II toxin-antitoxin system VapC family toxin [Oscillochloridaceae bacterium umkhey_bin13]
MRIFMVIPMMLPPEVFLDTAFALALVNPYDSLHEQATTLATELETQFTRLCTTQAILIEIGNALAKLCYRTASVQLLASLANDPYVEIVPISDDLYIRALRLYTSRMDKEWGLTDCISFVVMHERNLTMALTPDRHFRQAGFQTLMVQTT